MDDVGLGVLLEFLDPLGEIVVGVSAGEIEDNECTSRPLVVGVGDSPEALLASGVPDLCLHGAAVDADGLGGELDPDGGLGLLRELVGRKPRQQVGLPYSRVCVYIIVPPITTILNKYWKFSTPAIWLILLLLIT